jgi:hypothetical protein
MSHHQFSMLLVQDVVDHPERHRWSDELVARLKAGEPVGGGLEALMWPPQPSEDWFSPNLKTVNYTNARHHEWVFTGSVRHPVCGEIRTGRLRFSPSADSVSS